MQQEEKFKMQIYCFQTANVVVGVDVKEMKEEQEVRRK